ncbi:prepilin-type N-terminal cleavage/methylation domain-containing protein [Xanthobacter sp. V3C-3]|uniref:PulJ/GspJ family protein n=1 Tax=Xanthobacter lutulentifluminis TaxID=3119935 RepID=UPI00372B81C6
MSVAPPRSLADGRRAVAENVLTPPFVERSCLVAAPALPRLVRFPIGSAMDRKRPLAAEGTSPAEGPFGESRSSSSEVGSIMSLPPPRSLADGWCAVAESGLTPPCVGRSCLVPAPALPRLVRPTLARRPSPGLSRRPHGPGRAGRRRRAIAGFSLVEVLVALTLTGLVLSAIAMVTARWLPGWQRGLSRVQNADLLGLALDRATADIAAAEFVPAGRETRRPLFTGTAEAIIFVRTALGPTARPGLEVVRLAPLAGTGLARAAAPFVPRDARDGLPTFGAPVPVLDAAYGATFSFAGRDGVWRDSWTNAEALPRAVRIVVRDARTGRTLGASTAVAIRAELPAPCVGDETRPLCGRPATGAASAAAEPAAPEAPQ